MIPMRRYSEGRFEGSGEMVRAQTREFRKAGYRNRFRKMFFDMSGERLPLPHSEAARNDSQPFRARMQEFVGEYDPERIAIARAAGSPNFEKSLELEYGLPQGWTLKVK